MLIITLHNKHTYEDGRADYDYCVRVNYEIIAEGKIKKHKRSDGWQKLVKLMLKSDKSITS